jgi:hypothetical protein
MVCLEKDHVRLADHFPRVLFGGLLCRSRRQFFPLIDCTIARIRGAASATSCHVRAKIPID